MLTGLSAPPALEALQAVSGVAEFLALRLGAGHLVTVILATCSGLQGDPSVVCRPSCSVAKAGWATEGRVS